MEIELDKWQEDVLNTNGNIVLRSGRQVGKSTVISIKAAEYAVRNSKKSIMIVSATERQAYLLFSKVLLYISDNYKSSMKVGLERPTKSEIKLKNGSIIRCLPTGLDGIGIRGYTVDMLIADEAAFIHEDVWTAITPMLVTTGGTIILLSTPHGKKGYFYECFSDSNFTKFHISTETAAQGRKEPQRTAMLEFLEREKKTKSALVFAQEYLGEFLDELMQVFPDWLIKKVCKLKRRGEIKRGNAYYLGVDVASMGKDESTFEILDKINRDKFEQVENLITTKTLTTDTFERIVTLETQYNFNQIGIDDNGLGLGVFHQLLKHDSTKRKVIPLNNAVRELDRDGTKKKQLLKVEMYMNLLYLMEASKIELLDDDEIMLSLKSCQFEMDDVKKKLKISGTYTHIVEGIMRAAWLASQDKRLNIWVR